MTYQGVQGQDLRLEANSHVIIRLQGIQWRLDKPASGVAVFEGKWTRSLNYYGGKPIKGDLWIGKEKHAVNIRPRG